MQSKSTKKSLVASGLSLLMCAALLIGTTFAWFTDSVSNTGNRIQAGTLEIDLLMDKDGKGEGAYTSIADTTGDIFSVNGNGINWEPGRTEIVYLAVENKGSLAATFDLDIIPTAVERKKNLGDVLECAVIADMQPNDMTANNWNDLTEGLVIGETLFAKLNASRTSLRDTKIAAGDTEYFALAVHMKETAENDYQTAAVDIDIQINATQDTVEEDAFGNSNYDKDAQYAIYTSQDLKRMLTNPVDGAVYRVFADVAYDTNVALNSEEVSGSVSFTIDLNGHTLTLGGNSGYTTKGAVLNITVTDSSKNANGQFVHTGNGYMFVADGENNDTITGNGFIKANGQGIIDLGTATNE